MPMTPAEMERQIRNLDRRTARVEQILPTLATKDDLKGLATKEDLERFATKEDLKRFATKEDLKRFATKEDLKRFATKEDLKAFPTREDPKGFATKDDLEEVRQDLRRHMLVLIEDVRGDIRLVAEAVATLGRRDGGTG